MKVKKLFECPKFEPKGVVRGAVIKISNKNDSFGFDVFEMVDGTLKIFIPQEVENRIISD